MYVDLNNGNDNQTLPNPARNAEVAVGDAVVRVKSSVILVGGSVTLPATVAFNPKSGLAGYSL